MDRRARVVAVVRWFALAAAVLALLGLSAPARAIGTVAKKSTQTTCYGYYMANNPGFKGCYIPDPGAQFVAYVNSNHGACQPGMHWVSMFVSSYNGEAGFYTSAGACVTDGVQWGGTPTYFSMSRTMMTIQTLYCPGGSVESGVGQCVCPAGQRPDTSGEACAAYSCPSVSLGDASYGPYASSAAAMSRHYSCPTQGGTPYQGCTTSFSPDAAFEGASGWWVTGRESFTGGQCEGGGDGSSAASPADNAASEPGEGLPTDQNVCPQGQAPGEVNGQVVCYTPVNSETAPDVVTQKDAQGTVTGTTETKTTCADGACTTVTTTKDAGGVVTGTSSVTVSQGQYCAAHSGAAVCGASGSSSGSGDGGDEPYDPCVDHPERAGCAALGTGGDGGAVDVKVQPMAIAPTAGWDIAVKECPAPRTVQLTNGFALEMPFDLLCEFAIKINPVVIAVAWLVAVGSWLGIARRAS